MNHLLIGGGALLVALLWGTKKAAAAPTKINPLDRWTFQVASDEEGERLLELFEQHGTVEAMDFDGELVNVAWRADSDRNLPFGPLFDFADPIDYPLDLMKGTR